MANVTLRSVKGSDLTPAEVDANFTDLNNKKLELNGQSAYAAGNLGLGTTSPQATIVAAGSNATVYKAMILRNGNGTDGSSATIDFEASEGTQGNEASMVGRIAGLRTGSGTSGALTFSTTNAGTLAERARIDSSGNLIIGTAALATTATAGFPWIPSCAGIPTGAPAAPYTNAAAMVVDTTNNRLYVRVGSTWRYASLI
jgi:hypothetical protein